MVVGEPKRSIMEGIENTGDVRLHDHRLRLKQRFDIIRKLGQGTYGKVQLGINKKTGQEVAIKTIKKCKIETEADLVRIRREVQIMSSVRHPNIVHIYEVFENSEKMILVMEYCAGGELYDYLSQQKVLQEEEARRLFRQIATSVYYCHKHKICHRDLKLENVLLDEHGNAKIADFGLSNVFEERRLLSTFCGSPLYASPEIVKGTPYIGPEVDCWSLGVLLYTLVYGAMPFDGSNFKRLVKQISTGDYFEPKSPSTASPLIREMLTVDPLQRADITHICDNLWVNKGSDVSCLELAEALANETPVRLDLLLSLAPPPTIGSDKLVVTDEVSHIGPDGSPSRSMSIANIDNNAERRILEMVAEGGTDAIKPSPTRTIVTNEQPKRKLETTVSMDSAPSQRKKERVLRSSSGSRQDINRMDGELPPTKCETFIESKEIPRDVSMINKDMCNADINMGSEEIVLNQNIEATQEEVKQLTPIVSNAITKEPSLVIMKKESPSKVVPTHSPDKTSPVTAQANKECKVQIKPKETGVKDKSVASKPSVVKKKVSSLAKKEDKPKTEAAKEISPPRKSIEKDITGRVITSDKKSEEKKSDEATPAFVNETSPVKVAPERRRSRILDTAEKLNNLSIHPNSSTTENVQSPPKPKKVIIPGVSVGSFKEQFERRASLTSGNIPVPSNDLKKKPEPINKASSNVTTPVVNKSFLVKKINSIDSEHPIASTEVVNKESSNIKLESIGIEPSLPPPPLKEDIPKAPEVKKPAIIEINKVPKILHKSESLREPTKRESLNNSLSLEDARRSLQQSMVLLTQAKNEVKQENTDDYQSERQKQLKTAREIISNAIGDDGKKINRICMGAKPPMPYGSGGRSSSGTISLNSLSSLPSSPPTSPPHPRPIVRESPARTFRTEVQHRVDDVRNKFFPNSRGGSVERIIPIHFGDDAPKVSNPSPAPSSQLPYQRNNSMPFRLGSLPRGCTPDYESEQVHQQPPTPLTPASVSKSEPIRKSPREIIIPIEVEGKGYVTPRQGSLEPNDIPNKLPPSNIGFGSRFPKPRRISSLVSGGESEDDDDLHMHRLRSTRKVRVDPEKDSVSSGEEDDDERFELLTAENLFSTLLDRVRTLTNRLNGEEGTGFSQHHPSLFNNLHSPFFNSPHLPRPHKKHNVIIHKVKQERARSESSETRDGAPWRRSASRDMPDFDSIFPSFPRGSKKSRKAASNLSGHKSSHSQTTPNDLESSNTEQPKDLQFNQECLDLSDLDLSKIEFSEKDMEALSGLTPALSRRLQKQLLDHLPPAAARSLRRTLSLNTQNTSDKSQQKYTRSLSANKTINNNYSHLEEDEKSTEDNTYTSNNGKHGFSLFDDDDTSSISYSSIISKQDKDLNRVDSTSLKHDTSYNSLDRSNGRSDPESLNPRFASSVRSTPERSVLSKYLAPDDYYGISRNKLLNDSSLDYNLLNPNNNTPGLLRRLSPRTASIDSAPRRRISRFLRPDFFDTPREESIYVREKLDKETETQQILKEIRERRSRSGATSPLSPMVSTDMSPFFEVANSKSKTILSPVSPTANRSRSVTPFYPILDNIHEVQSDFNANNQPKIERIESDNKVDINMNSSTDAKATNQEETHLPRRKSFPCKDNIMSAYIETEKQNISQSQSTDTKENEKVKKVNTRESKIIRPKSYPAASPSPEKKIKNIPENRNSKENSPNSDSNHTVYNITPPKKNSIDDDNNITVTFNINLPPKVSKVVKEEEKVTNAPIEEIKKTSPKKKIIIKKKSSSAKSVSSANKSDSTSSDSNVKSDEVKETQFKKRSVLRTIGQKIEKLRSDSFSKSASQEKEVAIKKQNSLTTEKILSLKAPQTDATTRRVLREQSVPIQAEPTTESGLIKRAVTVTNLPTLESQSKKSVNKVFGLFKKSDSKDKLNKSNLPVQTTDDNISNGKVETDLDKPKRPTSLLLNGIGKRVQACYNGALSDNSLIKPDKKISDGAAKSEESKSKKGLKLDFSRLPKLNQSIFNKRNSLDPKESEEFKDFNGNEEVKADCETRQDEDSVIDFNSVSNGDYTPTTESSVWSPDCNSNKFASEQSQRSCSPDYSEYSQKEHDNTVPESENIIDRIRRKSFYSRFNEKKNRRKSLLVGPGAKEYIPSARINPQSDSDDIQYSSRYDPITPTSPTKYTPANLNFEKPESSLPSPRIRSTYGNDHFLTSAHTSLDRNDGIYSGGLDSSSYTLVSRYPRTVSYFDDYDARNITAETKSPSSRYGRTLSLLSPGIYATYSPRSHTRNPAILLRDSVDSDTTSEDILTRIRNRKKAGTQNISHGDEHTLDNKFRSNHIHDSEHDMSANKLE